MFDLAFHEGSFHLLLRTLTLVPFWRKIILWWSPLAWLHPSWVWWGWPHRSSLQPALGSIVHFCHPAMFHVSCRSELTCALSSSFRLEPACALSDDICFHLTRDWLGCSPPCHERSKNSAPALLMDRCALSLNIFERSDLRLFISKFWMENLIGECFEFWEWKQWRRQSDQLCANRNVSRLHAIG